MAEPTPPPKVENPAPEEANQPRTPQVEPKAPKETATPNPAPAPEATRGQPASVGQFVPLVILLLAGAILFLIATNWNSWVGRPGNQKTDDAYLRADITPLSTRVSGTVVKVAVEDYQKVKAGDLLVQLKDDDYQAQLEQAEAGVGAARAALESNASQKALQETRIAQSQAGIEAAKADIAKAEAGIEAVKADISNAQAGAEATKADVVRTQLEKKRQAALVESASATSQKLEQVTADEERFRAIWDSRKAELAKTQALLALRGAELRQAHAGLAAREADHQAQHKQRLLLNNTEQQLRADLLAKESAVKIVRTNLEYTRIVAPNDGIVGERKVRVGQLVSPGTQVISLVESKMWVQANYKETQLTNVSQGDSAQITVDSFPGLKLRGRVAEIAPASGSQFALLPPDNASGNFTKIVQRIPVKIELDPDQRLAGRLRPGMSVIVEINASGRAVGSPVSRKEP
ncbi:MAG: efflux RND transporter periplasmic adaptor subunit [Blastocatellia bacterium]|nr:efflux RND transporter periplasmic adaptor subunit [Blastocatellia bacterium]